MKPIAVQNKYTFLQLVSNKYLLYTTSATYESTAPAKVNRPMSKFEKPKPATCGSRKIKMEVRIFVVVISIMLCVVQ